MSATLKRFLGLALGFFLLYALTAQRGLGWGDSGEFQHWVLERTDYVCGQSFSNSHPLYVWFARLFSATPFHVTLVSAFFGALSVGGLFLCTRNLPLSALFGIAHMPWWLSCLAEVQTMNLAFTAFGALAFLRYAKTGSARCLAAAAFLAGLQLQVHNFALLSLPVYAVFFLRRARFLGFAEAVLQGALALGVWAIGAAYWLVSIAERGLGDVLVGRYGGQVSGLVPQSPSLAAFNLALGAMSFFVPAALAWWNRQSVVGVLPSKPETRAAAALFAVNFLFFIRYFVPDQATFALPSLFFAFILAAGFRTSAPRWAALGAMQLLLPLMAWQAAQELSLQDRLKARHKYRDEAAYFALPWKFNDDSADRCARELPGPWNGYPGCGEGGRR